MSTSAAEAAPTPESVAELLASADRDHQVEGVRQIAQAKQDMQVAAADIFYAQVAHTNPVQLEKVIIMTDNTAFRKRLEYLRENVQ